MRTSRTLTAGMAVSLWLVAQTATAATITGVAVDRNGTAVPDVQLVLTRTASAGARAVTVFSGPDGRFAFPGDYPDITDTSPDVKARTLGYRQTGITGRLSGTSLALTVVLSPTDNQAEVAPASAWLNRITDRREKSKFVMDCIDCHQVPGPEVRDYAASIHDMHAADPKVARSESWKFIAKYMNYLSDWEFSRGRRSTDEKINSDAVYGVTNSNEVAAVLARTFDDRLDHLSGFRWGAPLIATPRTTIWEYEIAHPTAVREALLLGDSRSLWVADVAANRMVEVDLASGSQRSHEVPSDVLMSPHSLHRDKDGALWVTPLFNSIVAKRDMKTGKWTTWRLKTPDGKNPGIHDLSFGHEHELLTDASGRIWFSDIGNTGVGYFDPKDGASRVWPAPQPKGRQTGASLYGLAMTRNRKEVWYSQLGNGVFGGFDIEKQSFIGPFELPDPNAGPRRITISDDDVVYLALYGSGQLAEFDAKTRKMVGVYDLPDTGSAPYSATWDPVRRVVWVITSNGDVIYRFNPRDKSFGVLPMPRNQAFLRMLDVDPATGVLVTSYANIVDIVQGPRMALVIDPGDGAYPQRFTMPVAPVVGAPPGSSRPTAPPSGADGRALVESARCYMCHDATKVSLGPPWQAIAVRHASRRDLMTEVLAQKIVHGGGGSWGAVPMAPTQWVTEEEARRMAAWILGQAPQ